MGRRRSAGRRLRSAHMELLTLRASAASQLPIVCSCCSSRGRRLRGRPRFPAAATRRRARATGTRRSSTTAGRCRRTPTGRNTGLRSSARCRTRRACTSTRAHELEAEGSARRARLLEYASVAEFDPSQPAGGRAQAIELEKTIRDRIEAARPKPAIEQMREQARADLAEPMLDRRHASRSAFSSQRQRARHPQLHRQRDRHQRHLRPRLPGRPTRCSSTASRSSRRSADPDGQPALLQGAQRAHDHHRSDTPQKRAQYEEQVIRTFYISHADVQELAQLISPIIRVPQMAVQPMVAVNKTANTITVRATAPVAAIIERIIEANDKPRAEIVIDVEILEVNRTRAKQYGLNLTQLRARRHLSRRKSPPPTTTDRPTAPRRAASPPPFNLNTISQGVSTRRFLSGGAGSLRAVPRDRFSRRS